MKRKKGENVTEKVIIVHRSGVSDEVRTKYQKKFPKANVKPVHADEVIKEAVTFRQRVNHIVYMPEIDSHVDMTRYWEGATSETYSP